MLNTSGSYRRVHSSTISGSTAAGPNTLASSLGTGTNTSGIGLFGGGSSRTFDLYQAGFDASWEIDVFGGTRRNIESANADIAAALEDRNDVLISLISEVAINYIDLRAFMQRISIARKNLDSQAKTLELVRQQLEAGTATDLQVAQAQAQFATTAAQVPAFETSARQLMHQLGTLLGKEPMAFEQLLAQDAPIPSGSPRVPPGLPSDLLRQRPDIRRAERQLASATAQVGVAVADWFPKFSLTGAAGRQSTTFSGLSKSGSSFWSFGPAINWPIFDAGRIRSNIKLQKALRLQASINYQQTVLNALREVEDALVAYARQQDRRKDLTDAVNANRRAVELANQLYTYGRTDFLNVLTAQASLYSAEDALAQADQVLSSNAVTLYKALGGGWQNIK
jgi:NodT family efflux transporter outer membrane factor (OMF) lipoprotein